jgi:hypothetical protein
MGRDQVERGQPFGMARHPRQPGADDQPGAVLHQAVTDEAQPGLHARPLAIQHGIGVGG